jgi:hypothetical protein
MRERYRRWIRLILRLYPQNWRERYLDEMLLVVEQFPATGWTVVDFALGALDARLHPDLVPWRITSMAQRLRTTAITIFCAIILFSLAWAGTFEVRDPLPIWEVVVQRYPAVQESFEVVQGSGLVVILALLVGGIPIALGALRDAFASRKREILLLFLVPILAVGGLALFAVLTLSASTARITPGNPDSPLTPLAVVLQLVLAVLLVGVIGGSTAAVAAAIVRTEIDTRILRFALLPALLATAAMGTGFGATVVLAGLSYDEAPQLAPGNLAVCAAMMLGALILAIAALRRGLRAARESEDILALHKRSVRRHVS